MDSKAVRPFFTEEDRDKRIFHPHCLDIHHANAKVAEFSYCVGELAEASRQDAVAQLEVLLREARHGLNIWRLDLDHDDLKEVDDVIKRIDEALGEKE